MITKIKILLGIMFYGLLLTGCGSKEIEGSQLIDLVQSNYLSIEIKDKVIEAGSDKQYLIDDFIPRLSRYKLKEFEGELLDDYSTEVVVTYKDGSTIRLIDNSYLILQDKTYEITEGNIDLEKFYRFIG